MKLGAFLVLAALAGTSACGVVYTSPGVSDGGFLGQASGTDYNVEVIRLTDETARAANLEPYVPARLPLAFQPGAADKVAQATRSALQPLPPAPDPSAAAEARPSFIPDRFPPLGEPEPYRIGVGDVVLLSVTSQATLEQLPGLITAQSRRQGYVVQDDGSIAIPDAGRVQIGGMTIQDAEAEIFRTLVSAGIDPAFSLEVAEFNSKRISVGGQVAEPALIPITLKPLYLHEALQTAGGAIAPDPRTAKVQIFRNGEIYQIGMQRFLTDPAAQRVLMEDGDSVFVIDEYREDAAARAFQERLALRDQQLQSNQASLQIEQQVATLEQRALERLQVEQELFEKRLELGAVERGYAYVGGEVRRAGRFALPFEGKASLADVLFDRENAGLDIRTADMGEIYLIRAASDPRLAGKVTAYHLDAENAVNLAAATRLEVHPNDVVFVAEQPITAWNRVLSQILPQIFLQATNQAINF